jgi:hypothetical protein
MNDALFVNGFDSKELLDSGLLVACDRSGERDVRAPRHIA